MSRGRLALWFAAAFVVALAAFAPLRLVLPRLPLPPGLTATEVAGSLWRGHLRQARWRGAAIGEVRLGLSPLPLLTGRQRLWLRVGHGRLALSAGRLRGIEDGHGVVPLPPVHGMALRASLEGAQLLFDDSGCSVAGGRVRIEATLPGDHLPPLLLAVDPACEGRSGRLVLVSEEADAPLWLEATLAVEGDGRYSLHALARTADPAVRLALLAHGFQDAPGGLSLVVAGHVAG